ncbi:hypothetical protein EG68_01983, partial [Paragonimus skrjabini miyazakii]
SEEDCILKCRERIVEPLRCIVQHRLRQVTRLDVFRRGIEELLEDACDMTAKDFENLVRENTEDFGRYVNTYVDLSLHLILYTEGIITDKLVQGDLQLKCNNLKRQHAELSSFIQQNRDVLKTLENMERDANGNKQNVEENCKLLDDICRKNDEIRRAGILLSGVEVQKGAPVDNVRQALISVAIWNLSMFSECCTSEFKRLEMNPYLSDPVGQWGDLLSLLELLICPRGIHAPIDYILGVYLTRVLRVSVAVCWELCHPYGGLCSDRSHTGDSI